MGYKLYTLHERQSRMKPASIICDNEKYETSLEMPLLPSSLYDCILEIEIYVDVSRHGKRNFLQRGSIFSTFLDRKSYLFIPDLSSFLLDLIWKIQPSTIFSLFVVIN